MDSTGRNCNQKKLLLYTLIFVALAFITETTCKILKASKANSNLITAIFYFMTTANFLLILFAITKYPT